MDLEKYALLVNTDHRSYEFYSEGPRGRIKKVVQYRQLKNLNEKVFNLGFGDWDEKDQKVNDKVTSNNKDRQKILKTVAATVLDFTKHYPDATIYAEGATPSRTRLYQMSIATFWEEISEIFDTYGFRNGEWEPFEKGRNYGAFVVKRKEKL